MIKQSYINGFIQKCAEYNINPTNLLKLALDPAALGTITTMPPVPPPKPTAPARKSIHDMVGTTKTVESSRPNILSVSHDKLRKAMEKVLAEKQKSQPAKTRQPLLITR